MATIDAPGWFRAAECSLTLQKNSLLWRSQFDGTPQTAQQPGERWVMNLTLPPVRIKTALAAERRAFFNRLAGGADRLRVGNLAQPKPLGTLRGLPTLGASASRGASTLTLAGALSGANLLSGGDMEVDSNADGLSDGVSVYSTGTTGTLTTDRLNVTYGYAQRIFAAGLGTTTSDRVGLRLPRSTVTSFRNGPMTFACDVFGSGVPASYYLSITWRTSADVYISETISTPAPLPTGGLTRVSVTGTVPSTATYADVYVIARQATSVGLVGLWVDRGQLEPGSSPTNFVGPPSLYAGDMIGCGGQLFEVMDSVELSDIGTGVVYVNNRVRAPLSSGSAVLWDAPTATFITPTSGASVSYSPGWQQAIACDLEEVWDA
jgi:hypothetical protein